MGSCSFCFRFGFRFKKRAEQCFSPFSLLMSSRESSEELLQGSYLLLSCCVFLQHRSFIFQKRAANPPLEFCTLISCLLFMGHLTLHFKRLQWMFVESSVSNSRNNNLDFLLLLKHVLVVCRSCFMTWSVYIPPGLCFTSCVLRYCGNQKPDFETHLSIKAVFQGQYGEVENRSFFSSAWFLFSGMV